MGGLRLFWVYKKGCAIPNMEVADVNFFGQCCWTRPLMIGVEIVFLCVFWLCYCFVFLCIARQRASVLTTCSFQFRLCDCHWLPQFEWNMAGENCWEKHCAHSCCIGVFCTQFYGFIYVRALHALPLITPPRSSKALWQAIRGQSQYAACLSCSWPTGFASFHIAWYLRVCVCIFPLNQTWNARQEDGDCRCMFSNFDVMGDFFSEL